MARCPLPTHLVTALFACCAITRCAPSPDPARELRLTDQRFTADTIIDVDRLVLTANAHVRIEHGALLELRTRELVIEGAAQVDGAGSTGSSPEQWTSSPGGALSCEIAHRDWDEALIRPTQDRGGPGGSGGHFDLRYQRLMENGGALASVRFTMNGGPGGAGRRLRCGCYALDVEHRAHLKSGPDGPDGRPGSARVVREEPAQ